MAYREGIGFVEMPVCYSWYDLLAKCDCPLLSFILEKNSEDMRATYEETEKLWLEQFHCFDHNNIRLVILSEAPLSEESYFYNPKSGATPFFNYKDYNEVFSSHESQISDYGGKERKHKLLQELCKAGVLFIDLFPFALNNSTQVSYRKLGSEKRKELFEIVAPYYFYPKMLLILKKMTPDVRFVFRYKRILEACGENVKSKMAELKIVKQLKCESIGNSKGRGINRTRLKEIYDCLP